MSRYALSANARDGLARILEYVELNFDVPIALRVAEEIELACQRLAENPRLGHFREDITEDPRIRFWSVGPTIIAYRASKDGIEVLFVERGERDWRVVVQGDI